MEAAQVCSLTSRALLWSETEAVSPNAKMSPNQKEMGPKASAVRTYPDGVVLSVLFPVAAGVAEHQRVAGHPVWAPVPALGSDRDNLHSVSQINLEPLLLIWVQRGPATSSWKRLDKENLDGKDSTRNYTWESTMLLFQVITEVWTAWTYCCLFIFCIRKYATWGALP